MNNFFRIFSILKKLAKAKYYFLLPEKKDILIFDTNGADLIKSILPKNSYHILPTRYESLNFLFLINCLFSFRIRMRSYLQKYIDYINPKILITYIDNNPLFYELKLKHGKKFFIQNGRRTALDIFFSKNKLKKKKFYFVDYMLVHNDIIGKKYQKLIRGKSIKFGSLQSNSCKVIKSQKKYDLMYVSTFRQGYTQPDNFLFGIKYSNYIKKEIFFLKWLRDFSDKNKRHISILGSERFPTEGEKQFYKNIFGNNDWRYIERTPKRKTYKIIDQSFIILGIDSTLIYEALSRGLRVGFFGIRGNKYPLNSRKFGWPDSFRNQGPFWTNLALEKEFKRIINNLINYSSKKWDETSSKYKKNLLHYNFQNTLAKNLIKENLK